VLVDARKSPLASVGVGKREVVGGMLTLHEIGILARVKAPSGLIRKL
jgi:hypothetical protein